MRSSLKPFRNYERTSTHDRVKNDTSDFDQYNARDSQDEKFTNHIIPLVHYLIKRRHEDSRKYWYRLAQTKPFEPNGSQPLHPAKFPKKNTLRSRASIGSRRAQMTLCRSSPQQESEYQLCRVAIILSALDC